MVWCGAASRISVLLLCSCFYMFSHHPAVVVFLFLFQFDTMLLCFGIARFGFGVAMDSWSTKAMDSLDRTYSVRLSCRDPDVIRTVHPGGPRTVRM